MKMIGIRLAFSIVALCILAASCSAGGETPDAEVALESPVIEYLNGRPALIDLGSTTCIPCQMMEEELEKLEAAAGDKLDVQFINVNQNRQAAGDFGVRVIPTQVFLSESGEELFRHEGYIPFEDMMTKWIELGYTFE